MSSEHRAVCTLGVALNHTKVRMPKKEDFVEIQALANAGVYLRDVAEQLGVIPKTVSRTLGRGSAPGGPRRPHGSPPGPFLPAVDRLLTEGARNVP
jgi:hypothetical protein